MKKRQVKRPLKHVGTLASLDLNAEQALSSVRNHWQVESMHWVLEMTFREDESRIRKGRGPLAFNVMRKIAMTLFKQDQTKRASLVQMLQ
ncbi:hypothetical protein KT99_12454 [Shewanella benthica KT99]|uniref:Transposase IS4-like domain-containing protein n=1 Tax=Shewanella benthica KT99 TaxID=314608 RepID=A9DM71_9GAMM|nr:hypothetical protein KT99_12454 [Shewanella benthica KT99]